MIKYFSRFRIPTLLGLVIILVGIIAGVFLVYKDTSLISKAAPDVKAQNISVTNILDSSATISFETGVDITSFITFGINSADEKTILDDRDSKNFQPRKIHYFTIKSLIPNTIYQFKITTGKHSSEILKFQTAKTETQQNGFSPVIGSVLSSGKPVSDGVVYLILSETITQSALLKNGNFLIPLSLMRKKDLSDTFIPNNASAKITVISNGGEANLLFKLNSSNNTLPPINIGENKDIIDNNTIDLRIYDLNNDGQVNATDNAIVLKNFGKNPKDKRTDFNKDGVVDQNDLDLISEQINR